MYKNGDLLVFYRNDNKIIQIDYIISLDEKYYFILEIFDYFKTYSIKIYSYNDINGKNYSNLNSKYVMNISDINHD